MILEIEVVGRQLHIGSWNLGFKLIFEGHLDPCNGSQFSCIFTQFAIVVLHLFNGIFIF